MRRGVGAGAAALPQPQHPSCGEERERRHPWVPSQGKGKRSPGTALQGPAGGPDTPARPDPPRLQPLRRAGTRVNFLEAKVGLWAGPESPSAAPPSVRSDRYRCAAKRCWKELAQVPGGPRSPLRALSSGSFLAMGSPSPRAGWTGTGNREPGTGNRERGTGPAPGAERSSPAPQAGGTSHTQVYVYLN